MGVKIKFQLKECLREQKDDSRLSQQDIIWDSSLDLQFQKAASIISLFKFWQIRAVVKEFQGWIANQSRHSLFFDGAAKGNPARAGAGVVIMKLGGIEIHNFA